MKLYVTLTSPYARMARMMVLEKKLEKRLEVVVAKTRTAGSPYYEINPSGRVPYLVRDDGVGMEDSGVICAYLDHLDGKPAWDVPPGWDGRRLEASARSMLDGLSVWNREMARPQNERSPGIIRHEMDRAQRMADLWEGLVEHPLMRGAPNMIQLTLACTLGLEARNAEFRWRPGRAKLEAWFDAFAARPSFTATSPV